MIFCRHPGTGKRSRCRWEETPPGIALLLLGRRDGGESARAGRRARLRSRSARARSHGGGARAGSRGGEIHRVLAGEGCRVLAGEGRRVLTGAGFRDGAATEIWGFGDGAAAEARARWRVPPRWGPLPASGSHGGGGPEVTKTGGEAAPRTALGRE